MIELVFLSVLVLLFLYSYVYNYIAIFGIVLSVFVALKLGVDPLVVWIGIYSLTVFRIVKPRLGQE